MDRAQCGFLTDKKSAGTSRHPSAALLRSRSTATFARLDFSPCPTCTRSFPGRATALLVAASPRRIREGHVSRPAASLPRTSMFGGFSPGSGNNGGFSQQQQQSQQGGSLFGQTTSGG